MHKGCHFTCAHVQCIWILSGCRNRGCEWLGAPTWVVTLPWWMAFCVPIRGWDGSGFWLPSHSTHADKILNHSAPNYSKKYCILYIYIHTVLVLLILSRRKLLPSRPAPVQNDSHSRTSPTLVVSYITPDPCGLLWGFFFHPYYWIIPLPIFHHGPVNILSCTVPWLKVKLISMSCRIPDKMSASCPNDPCSWDIGKQDPGEVPS